MIAGTQAANIVRRYKKKGRATRLLPVPTETYSPAITLRWRGVSLWRRGLSLWALLLVLAAPTMGQVFELQGGTSSLLGAHGGSINFRAPSYQGWLGIGQVAGKPRFGSQLKLLFHKD